MRRTMQFCAGLGFVLMSGAFSADAQEAPTPFPPPIQYTSIANKPFDSLVAANIKWLQSKITDRKRKRRFELNNMRLPGSDKARTQALIDQLDAELKDATAALAVLKSRSPDLPAEQALVKANVTDWIKVLNQRAENLRKDAAEASDRAKNAIKQFDVAKAQADAADDNQSADNFNKEAKALAADLAAAGL
jgi:hypothetical protein